jgi:hypothetical protein
VLAKLGIVSTGKVIFYRIQVAIGWFGCRLPCAPFNVEIEFNDSLPSIHLYQGENNNVKALTKSSYNYFFYKNFPNTSPPDWFVNPLTSFCWAKHVAKHWSKVVSCAIPGEDIKGVWELSRFHWSTYFASACLIDKDRSHLKILECWLKDWCKCNPANQGVHWFCAQEVAMRLINFVITHLMLNARPGKGAIEFCMVHLKRISKTLHYADAQNNNHATSEAAALYLTSLWLRSHKFNSKFLQSTLKKGRSHLEKKVDKLILGDGCFSQYSATYHRVVLDTISLCVVVNRKYKDTIFSNKFLIKYKLAFEWLQAVVDPDTGCAANFGANDGALLFKLDSCDYRDFRPSLQLASVLLSGSKLFVDGAWDDPLKLLGVEAKESRTDHFNPITKEYPDGGLVRFSQKDHWALLKYPVFKFRPSQADAFHFDLWVKGRNILIDSGTYSYNPSNDDLGRFSTVKGHNTIEFDDHDQMPKLSRFLYGEWLKTKVLKSLKQEGGAWWWQGEYRDYLGCKHRREVMQEENKYIIIDDISGFNNKAILRWHTKDFNWQETNEGWISDHVEIKVKSDHGAVKLKKSMNKVSLYYHDLEDSIVFTAEVAKATAKLTTEVRVIN